MSQHESVRDPIIRALRTRLLDEGVPANDRYLNDPVARLISDSPKPWKSADESETQEPSGETESDSPEAAP